MRWTPCRLYVIENNTSDAITPIKKQHLASNWHSRRGAVDPMSTLPNKKQYFRRPPQANRTPPRVSNATIPNKTHDLAPKSRSRPGAGHPKSTSPKKNNYFWRLVHPPGRLQRGPPLPGQKMFTFATNFVCVLKSSLVGRPSKTSF